MTDILRDHALTHVWAEPLQDRQHRVKPNRVSPSIGFYKEATVMWERIPLPNYGNEIDNRSFHVYPIGQLPPMFFALTLEKRKWYSAATLVQANNTVIDLIADNGTIIPRDQYYFYVNYDNNFIMAVARNTVYLGDVTKQSPYGEELKMNYTLDDSKVTVRFYNNAVTHNKAWLDTANDDVHILMDHSKRITKLADFTSFMARVATIRANYKGQGMGLFFIDGFLVSEPKAFKDDYVGALFYFQYDETIKDVRQFDIVTIPGFRSIVDVRKDKYLLVSAVNNGVLEYKDDCDYYVVNRSLDGSYRGVAIDCFNQTPVRQITHNAWSVSQDSVIYPTIQHHFTSILNDLTILVVVRNGGMVRGIGLQSNRIEDLYHLKYEQILEAMSGVNSSVPEWQAPNLENSAYMKITSSQEKDITTAMVEDAYGYNATTYAVAKSQYPVVDGKVVVDTGMSLPWDSYNPNGNYRETRRTFFWYDVNGLLLGYTSNNSTARTLNVPSGYSAAKKVEVITGSLVVGVGEVGTHTDKAKVVDQAYGFYGHRNYVCNIVGSGPDNKWVDVTNSPYVSYMPAKDGNPPYIQWNYSLLNAANLYPATRFANTVNVHTVSFTLAAFTGVYGYDIMRIQDASLNVLQVPAGHFDVFMNGEILIPDLDFYYVPAGSIVIVRKPKTDVAATRIVIRFYGYMNPETNRPFKPRDVGFVKNGKLSMNQVFNTTHDRDIRINVNGQLKTRNEVVFAEDKNTAPLYLDGYPYAVEDYHALVEPFTSKNTVDYLMDAQKIDKRVGDYLSSRLPEPTPVDEFVTPYRHELYSPIMATLIQLLSTGKITDAMINLDATDAIILQQFGYLTQVYGSYDPAVVGFNENYCYVHPHPHTKPVQVTSKQYAFLERANRIFLKGVVDLTSSVTIKLGT